MFSLTKFQRTFTLLFIVVISYFSYVNNVIEVIPVNFDFYSDSSYLDLNDSSSELTNDVAFSSDQNQLQHLTTTTPVVEVEDVTQKFNVGQNFTIMTAEFFKYMASQLVDKPFPGVDNYTQYITAKLNLKPLVGVKPLRPDFGPVLNDVTSYQYPITIKPCQYVKNRTNIFIAIISAVGNLKKRSNIRETWIRHLGLLKNPSDNSSINLAGYAFIVGQSTDQNLTIETEAQSKKYGDILQVNIIDYYYNLTLKAVGLVNWLNSYCSDVDFVLKVDDDVFVNVRNLRAVISKTLNRSEPVFYGSSTWHPTERSGKWKISHEDYPWIAYPPYPTGQAVLLPGISIRNLLAAAQVIPYIPFDDTYLLGLCTEKAGIKIVDSGRVLAVGGNFGPCHVYQFIAWLPGGENNMNISFWATEDFYKNVTQCYLVRDGVNQTVNAFDYVLTI